MPVIETIVREINRDLAPEFEKKLRAHLVKQDKEWLIEQIVRLTLDAHLLEEMDRKHLQEAESRKRHERTERAKSLHLDENKLQEFIHAHRDASRESLIEKNLLAKHTPPKGGELITEEHRSIEGGRLLQQAKDLLFALLFGEESTNTQFRRKTLLVHLRMTGQLRLLPRDATPSDDAYARVCFGLDHGPWLLFSDMRKFGRMYLVNDPSEVLGELGPEPLMADFSPERLASLLARRKGRIKPLLLDQRFIAGLGNIYTDEALWRAGVHPLQKAETLTPDQIVRLQAGIVSILREAIEGCGTSLRDYQYRQPDGAMGEFQVLLAVYGRAGEDCPRCGAPIERLKLGQRGTHFCPRCQVLHA